MVLTKLIDNPEIIEIVTNFVNVNQSVAFTKVIMMILQTFSRHGGRYHEQNHNVLLNFFFR